MIGAQPANGKCTFCVWAPEKKSMELHVVHPQQQVLAMRKNEEGYFSVTINAPAGTQYFLRPNGQQDYPDPASHYQPQGVHGPSQVVDHGAYQWTDNDWRGIPLRNLILYELHVGTFTAEGTFEAIIDRLNDLQQLGINAIELMPVAQFPGGRNWGYDAVYPYAVQNSYGGPLQLKQLVDACHAKGIAVFLDVIYNHLGPEGNYFSVFGPYFTGRYHTPWGDALNFDGDWSDWIREYFVENIVHWFENYHIDGLRFDAIHMVYDNSAVHFWEQCHHRVKALEEKLGRRLYLTAESDLNSPKVVRPPDNGGYGFDAQWLDDFHHALYVILHAEGKVLYEDFGAMELLAKAYTDGFVHGGDYVKFRKRTHGSSSAGLPGEKFIVFNQNHDQVGNRVRGERLSMLVNLERLKVAAAAILLSPYIPMLFMGEEYADDTPFYYFVSHSDPHLVKAVQEGRKKEFENYKWDAEPPDPQDPATFKACTLQWQKKNHGKHGIVYRWHQKLIRFRTKNAVMQNFNKNNIQALPIGQAGLSLHRQNADGSEHLVIVFNFSEKNIDFTFPGWSRQWFKLLDSRRRQWLAPGDNGDTHFPDTGHIDEEITVPPLSVVVYSSVQQDV